VAGDDIRQIRKPKLQMVDFSILAFMAILAIC